MFWTDLPDAQPVGQDPIHGVGLHLGPLQLEAIDLGLVLPQSTVGVVVKLWSVGFTWGGRGGRGQRSDSLMYKGFNFQTL